MFNDDQVDYTRSLGKRSPAELCWCGWYPKGECPSCPPDKTGLDKIITEEALATFGHEPAADTRCTAVYETRIGAHVHVCCSLTLGHDGSHRHNTGYGWLWMDGEVTHRQLPDRCQRCGDTWPCKAVTISRSRIAELEKGEDIDR